VDTGVLYYNNKTKISLSNDPTRYEIIDFEIEPNLLESSAVVRIVPSEPTSACAALTQDRRLTSRTVTGDTRARVALARNRRYTSVCHMHCQSSSANETCHVTMLISLAMTVCKQQQQQQHATHWIVLLAVTYCQPSALPACYCSAFDD